MKIQRKYGTLLVNIILQPQEEKDMKKQRWLSLVLILALVVGLCSVCAAAADDQTAEQPAQEAADTVAEAEAAPADGTPVSYYTSDAADE